MAYHVDRGPTERHVGSDSSKGGPRNGDKAIQDTPQGPGPIMPPGQWDADYLWGDWGHWPLGAKWAFRWSHYWHPKRYPFPAGHPRWKRSQ